MKKVVLFLLLSILSLPLASQQKREIGYDLPGVVPVKGDYLYASPTEVSNQNYLEFLFHAKNKTGYTNAEHSTHIPDTLQWREKLSYNEPYVGYYFRHPAYRDYPVVGVTKAQAEAYCEWLTNILNESTLPRDNSPIKKVLVRLPTEAEWEFAALGGLDPSNIYPWGTTEVRNQKKRFKGDILANFVRGRGDYIGVAGMLNDNADITAPVRSYWPNNFGLYNTSGNVAEMVSDGDFTKGGSWRSTAYYLRIQSRQPMNKLSSSQVGFRYFIEVVELDKEQVKRNQDIKLNAKYLIKQMAELTDTLYAGRHEVSNRLYGLFLESGTSEEDGIDPKYYACQNEKWDDHFDYRYQHIYSWHPNYDNYPVVNITYEAAQAFCRWLTALYNSDPKREFTKVAFRLPTQAEWEFAARGGLSMSPYPWGGPYLRNSHGSLLCNFNPREQRFHKRDEDGNYYYDYPNGDISISRGLDGGETTLPVDSYHPNDYGLYNCSGNVAEMTQDYGISRGGSWASISDYVLIESEELYDGAAPTLGFRYFMEVLEK